MFRQTRQRLACVFLITSTSATLGAKNDQTNKSQEVIELGKALFFDPRLSLDGSISCNSCHNLLHNGSDGRPGSIGVGGQLGERTAPTVWNIAAYSAFFWDGRAKTLEEQAVGPITNPIEMAMPNHKAVEARVNQSGYTPIFARAFGSKQPVTIANIATAIAEFERTLLVRNSAYDKYKAGDKKALSPDAKAGLKLVTSIGCTSCHSGADFSGPKFPQGTPFLMKFPTFPDPEIAKAYDIEKDLGRYAVTKKAADKHMWRVPTWRNIALTAPYFHNGTVKTLSEAVRVMAKTQLNLTLKPSEIKQIVAFLESLTSDLPTITAPRLPIPMGKSLF